MLGLLIRMPNATPLTPFVKLSYASPSGYSWFDDAGTRRRVMQAEGGEQGDPLMLLLFSIGIQGALEEVAEALTPREQRYAFLDDVYIVCQPERVRVLFDMLAGALTRVAGIRLHDRKTRVWDCSGARLESIADLGRDVQQPRGITVWRTLLGSAEYITEKVERRLADERLLWETIPAVPDLQYPLQILLQSANPRASHTIRTLPPIMSEHHARGHDERIWATAKNLLSEVPGDRSRAGPCATVGNPPNAHWWSRVEVSGPMRKGSILGVMGRRVAHEREKDPSHRGDGGAHLGERSALGARMSLRTLKGCFQFGPATVRVATQLVRIAQGESALRRNCRRNPASGNMAGSIGPLPSQTPLSGRVPCCQAKLPRTGHTFVPIQVATLGSRWPTLPQLLST